MEERIRRLEEKVEELEKHDDDLMEIFDKFVDRWNKNDAEVTRILRLTESAINANSQKVDNLFKNLKGY